MSIILYMPFWETKEPELGIIWRINEVFIFKTELQQLAYLQPDWFLIKRICKPQLPHLSDEQNGFRGSDWRWKPRLLTRNGFVNSLAVCVNLLPFVGGLVARFVVQSRSLRPPGLWQSRAGANIRCDRPTASPLSFSHGSGRCSPFNWFIITQIVHLYE